MKLNADDILWRTFVKFVNALEQPVTNWKPCIARRA